MLRLLRFLLLFERLRLISAFARIFGSLGYFPQGGGSFMILPADSSSNADNVPNFPSNDLDPEPDLFDFFDPLLSPHSYPKGIRPSAIDNGNDPTMTSKMKSLSTTSALSRQERDSLRLDRLHVLGVPRPGPQSYKKEDYDEIQLDNVNYLGVGRDLRRDKHNLPSVDSYTSAVFDPTLSPHMYGSGTPAAVIGDQQNRTEFRPPLVGVLLIDHGSKIEGSNQRLHQIAALYQESVSSLIVQAAHMEIAQPSIQEGMERLLAQGVDEIVCHPFFLGAGRHVSEDIPRLIDDAVRSLNVEIPVQQTPHTGSDASIMIQAVHALVQQSSTLFSASRTDRL